MYVFTLCYVKKDVTFLRQWQMWLEMGNLLAQTDTSVCAFFKSTRLFDKNNNLQNAASSICWCLFISWDLTWPCDRQLSWTQWMQLLFTCQWTGQSCQCWVYRILCCLFLLSCLQCNKAVWILFSLRRVIPAFFWLSTNSLKIQTRSVLVCH